MAEKKELEIEKNTTGFGGKDVHLRLGRRLNGRQWSVWIHWWRTSQFQMQSLLAVGLGKIGGSDEE
jgi:hypothetical protein